LEDFREAAELDKDKKYISIYANLCRLEISRDDLVSEGIKNCQIVIDSPWSGASLKSDANQIIADALLREGRYDEALVYLENAQTFFLNDPNLFIGFANLYIAKGDYSKASEEAQKALDIDLMKTAAYRTQAYAFFMLEDYIQAEIKALKGLEVVKNDPSLMIPNKAYFIQQLNYILADIYLAKGDSIKEAQYREAGDSVMQAN